METLEEMEARQAKEIADAKVPTEKEMREAPKAWPKTIKELTDYIETLVKRPHDYGTCVYAMSLAAVATFNYVAHELGVTGFQASCADMDILRRTRNLKFFMIVDATKLLYPQYDIVEDVKKFLREVAVDLKEEAQKILHDPHPAASNVQKRCKDIVLGRPII